MESRKIKSAGLLDDWGDGEVATDFLGAEWVRYLPPHAQGDMNNSGVEYGVVSSVSNSFVRVKFLTQGIVSDVIDQANDCGINIYPFAGQLSDALFFTCLQQMDNRGSVIHNALAFFATESVVFDFTRVIGKSCYPSTLQRLDFPEYAPLYNT